jgi:predicted ATPase
LLERDEELGALVASLDSVRRTGKGKLVLVSGEAGIGKTALVRAL